MRLHFDFGQLAPWGQATRRVLWSAMDWWFDGFLEPLPETWRRWLLGSWGRALLEERNGGWVATWSIGLPSRSSELTVALSSGETFEAARATLGVSSIAQTVLVLGRDTVLHRRLLLPAATAPVLKNVVRNEVERLTPISKADLRLQYRIARHDRVQKRVLVDIFVTRASVVERAVAHWTERGWPIGRVTVRCGGEVQPLDFLAAAQRPKARWLSLPVPRWSVAIAAAVGVVALYAPGLRYAALSDTHSAELAELRTAAIAARDTLTRRDDLTNRNRFLAQQRADRVPALFVLSELTQILPDHTWLQQIHLTNARLQIQGDSASASTVVQLLEDSALFAGAQFSAPISSNPDDGRERFVIDLAVGAQP